MRRFSAESGGSQRNVESEVHNVSLASDLLRGHTEPIILARLLLRDSYGYEINKAIVELTSGSCELKEATLYTAFRRLESVGCITSYWGDETTGARRRYYAITRVGKDALTRHLAEWKDAKALIDKLLDIPMLATEGEGEKNGNA